MYGLCCSKPRRKFWCVRTSNRIKAVQLAKTCHNKQTFWDCRQPQWACARLRTAHCSPRHSSVYCGSSSTNFFKSCFVKLFSCFCLSFPFALLLESTTLLALIYWTSVHLVYVMLSFFSSHLVVPCPLWVIDHCPFFSVRPFPKNEPSLFPPQNYRFVVCWLLSEIRIRAHLFLLFS